MRQPRTQQGVELNRPSTYDAGVVLGPRTAEVAAVPLGALEADHVRISVGGSGVCGSNLAVWQGRPWFTYPLPPGAPGHEGWGTIAAVGRDVGGFSSIGEPVSFLHERAFAEVVDVPARDVVRLPSELSGSAFPGEALGCGFNIAARSGITSGQTVVIVGCGFIGCVVAAIASRAGAQVIGVSRRPFALEAVSRMGATATISYTDDDDVVAQVKDLNDGRLADVVVEAVGTQGPLDLAGSLTGERGRLIIAGFHQDGPRTVDLQLWNWRGIDVVNAHERDPLVSRRGIENAAAAVADGWFDPSPLYTHRVALRDMGEALDLMITRPEGFLKALVTP